MCPRAPDVPLLHRSAMPRSLTIFDIRFSGAVAYGPMSGTAVRITAVVLDVLDVLANSPPGKLAWGLSLCEMTGYGTGTMYPALDRLLKAGWIEDKWEDSPGEGRPRRRYYLITSTGRAAYRDAVADRARRRIAWSQA